jgi:beta-glucosidase
MSTLVKTLTVALLIAGVSAFEGIAVTAQDAGITTREREATAQAGAATTQATSDLPWMNMSLTPEQRADLLIPQMTLEQKVEQISNDTRPARKAENRPAGCEFQQIGRHIQGIPELAIPTVRMINGGTGVRGGDCLPEPTATGVPSTPASAATFNPELNRQLGEILGDEARRAGHQVMLAPGMNLHRVPYGGRNYEYQSEDPYLSGAMVVEQIKGIQAFGIHANAKHLAGNEQETQRRQMATVIAPRALHELYLLPFEMSVRDAEPASVMCAFPEINGASSCSSEDLLKTTLRQRWGFQGYVISDRRAVHDLGPSIKAGVDWELSHITPLHYSLDPQPGQRGNPGSEGIRAALAAGTITVSDIDQMLRRRYVQMFKFGHFETDFDVLFEAEPDFLGHGLIAREIAEQAIVLLKNQNNFLPLNAANIQSVALIGAQWFAGEAKLPPRSVRSDNTNVIAPYTVTPKEGLQNLLRALGSSATVTYKSGGGTGTKADRDAAVELAKKSDVVVVMVGDNPHELCDRDTLRLPIIPPADPNFCAYDDEGAQNPRTPPRGKGTDQEALMKELVAAPGVAQKMVVVLKTEGMVLMPWLDQVPALVEAWYPGQEDGNAVADILFGVRNPSGKLPMTFGNSEREAAYATVEQFPGELVDPPPWLNRPRLSAHYTEGLQVGYRWYEANNVRPVFPFGFGLSYTTFAYSDLSVASALSPQTGQAVLTVQYTITNTGGKEGAEASQVYLTLPPEANEPAKRLVGFQKVDLMPGAAQQVTVTIDWAASNHPLSYWVPANDAPVPGWANGTWSTASGNYTIHVGTSSADTPLVATVPVSFVPPAPLTVTKLEANGLPAAGTPITWTTSTTGGLPPLQYQFWRLDATGWSMAQDYGPRNTYTWTPGTADVGEHALQVWVRSAGSTATYDAWSGVAFTVALPAPPTVTMTADVAAPAPGTPVTWTASAMGGLPPLQYQFWRLDPSGWSMVQDYNPRNTFTWTPRTADLGQHTLQVWVRNAGSTASYDGWSGVVFTVALPTPTVTRLEANVVSSTPGTPVTWTANATGGLPPLQYQFWRLDAAGWSMVQDYGPRSAFTWTPSTADVGEHTLQVWVRNSGSTASYDAWSGVVFTVQDHPVVAAPQLLMIDGAHVAQVRDSLRRGEPQFQSALSALEADANRALDVAPVSVMDKPVTPPSGTKHDYMSQAPYWWPNPATPGGRPYIRRDGVRNPEIDRITDRANLGRLERAVSTLALAFYFTGREEYAEHAARLVRVWFIDRATRMNANLQFGQGIPGIADGRSAGVIETRFLPNIIDAATLIRGSPAWTASDEQGLHDWMRAYLTWLIESPFGRDEARRGNNQETWADVQVVALAFYTGRTDTARKVVRDARTDIADEFEPDGRQPREIARTRAWDYSIFDLTAFLHLAALGEQVGVDLWNYTTADGRSLRKGVDFLIPFATGEKRFPYRQITEFRPSELHAVLRRAAVGFIDPKYRNLATRIGGSTPRLDLTLP